jgi:hypothetical protein
MIEKKFSVNNISVFEVDENGKYFFVYDPSRHCDMISDFIVSPNVTIHFKVGNICYSSSELKEFIFLCATYHEFKIIFTFVNKPEKDEIVTLNYIEHKFEDQTRKNFISGPIMKSSILYSGGLTHRIKNINSLILNTKDSEST